MSLVFFNQPVLALAQWISQEIERHENLLKFFLEAGVTPDWAEDPEDKEVLKGQIYLEFSFFIIEPHYSI